jgi:hypothetical protein
MRGLHGKRDAAARRMELHAREEGCTHRRVKRRVPNATRQCAPRARPPLTSLPPAPLVPAAAPAAAQPTDNQTLAQAAALMQVSADSLMADNVGVVAAPDAPLQGRALLICGLQERRQPTAGQGEYQRVAKEEAGPAPPASGNVTAEGAAANGTAADSRTAPAVAPALNITSARKQLRGEPAAGAQP